MGISDWIALAGVIGTLITALLVVWATRRQDGTSREIALASLEAETLPRIFVQVRERIAFPNGAYLEAGENYRHIRPPYDEHARLLLFISVRNEGKVPVKIKQIGVQVHERFAAFPGADLSDQHRYPALPLTLDGFDQIECYVDPVEVRDMLVALLASKDGTYTVDAVDAIDRHYSSPPLSAKDRLVGHGFLHATLNVPTYLASALGEEEYFPDGVPLKHSESANQPRPR